MRLPYGEHAFVDTAKLREYCLNMEHPEGRHKARVFLSALGLTAGDAEELAVTLRKAARENEATAGRTDDYGERYTIDLAMRRGTKQAAIRSAWIIRRGESNPRLTSCYIL